MLCCKCGKTEATIKFKQIVNGVIKDYEVCKNCYAKQNNVKYNVAKVSTKLQSNFKNSQKTCEFCGRTFEEIKNTAYVGCNYCYVTFKEELNQIIEKYHNIKSK